MRDIWVIIATEFKRRVRSRAYLFGTVLGAVGLVAIFALPQFLGRGFGEETPTIVVAGDPALVAQAAPLLAQTLELGAPIVGIPAHPDLAFLDAHGHAHDLLVLRRDGAGIHALLYTRDPATAPRRRVAASLEPLNIAQATGLPLQRIAPLMIVPLEVRSLNAKFGSEAAAVNAQAGANAIVLLLYLAAILNGQSVIASVAEEKTSRIAEILVAIVAPSRLLAGKVVAVIASSFVQLVVWVTALVVAQPHLVADSAAGSGDASPFVNVLKVISPASLPIFAVIFLIAFVQYALLYAAATSLINRTEDLGSVSLPVTLPVIASFLAAQFAISQPSTSTAVTLSALPLIGPFVMAARVAVSTVPWWQLLLALLVNVAAIAVIAWGSGKIYRTGLLNYGRLPNFRQVLATLRA